MTSSPNDYSTAHTNTHAICAVLSHSFTRLSWHDLRKSFAIFFFVNKFMWPNRLKRHVANTSHRNTCVCVFVPCYPYSWHVWWHMVLKNVYVRICVYLNFFLLAHFRHGRSFACMLCYFSERKFRLGHIITIKGWLVVCK